jgi:hypothetical protein
MPLILAQEAGRTTSSPRRRSSPKDIVDLFMPRDLHIVHLLDDHVGRVPTVRVPLGGRVVVMGGDEDIPVPGPLGGRKHGVERMNGPPIGEEMTLLIMSPRMIAVRILVIDLFGELEIGAEGGRHPGLFEAGDGLLTVLHFRTDGAEQPTGLGFRVTGTSIGFPDVTVPSPIGGELASQDVFDSLCGRGGDQLWRPWHTYARTHGRTYWSHRQSSCDRGSVPKGPRSFLLPFR